MEGVRALRKQVCHQLLLAQEQQASLSGLSSINLPSPVSLQVVVVVLADWSVICLDHNLRVMWTTRVRVSTGMTIDARI